MARQSKPWFWKARKAWFVTLDGVRHSLGPDKRQAQERFRELLRQPQTQRLVDSRSLVSVIDAFLEWTQKHRSADTYEWYRFRLERLARRYPDMELADLQPYHVQQWVDSYPDIARNTRRNYLRAVKRCLKWTAKSGYLQTNPLEHLELPGAEHREVCVTPDQYSQLLAHIPDAAFRDLVISTWETGCRPQESLRVEARHVDLKNRRWVFPRKEAKGKRQPRVVYLTGEAFEITARLAEQYPTGPLFRNSRGVPWTTDAVNCAFDRVRLRLAKPLQAKLTLTEAELAEFISTLKPIRKVKGVVVPKTPADLRQEAKRKLLAKKIAELVPRYSLYSLRHAWATRALQSGLDGLTVAILMGHSDPSTLARVYQHLSHNPQHLLAQAGRVTH